MARSKERIQARTLRKQGKSIKEISTLLEVSKGSVSTWCRDIILTNEQTCRLQDRMKDPNYGRRAIYLNAVKERTNKMISDLHKQGINEVGILSKRDIFLIGIALYWGEGFKKDHQVGFATSDVAMAKFFILWLEKAWGITSESLILRVTTNIAYKDNVDEIQAHWANHLKISAEQFSKPFFQNVVWQKEYEDKKAYLGVIRIKVKKSVNLLRKMYGYIDALRSI